VKRYQTGARITGAGDPGKKDDLLALQEMPSVPIDEF
jgi:hypothetical protein